MKEIRSNLNSMMNRVKEIKIERKLNQESLAKAEVQLANLESTMEKTQKARVIVQIVAEQTQSKMQYHIANLVSMALAAIWPDPYTFHVEFVQKRNQTECNLKLEKNGHFISPMYASGGGVKDVVSFALKIAAWSIKPTRNVFILDEPFKFVSVDLQEKCSEMVTEISRNLNMQIIMNSHLPNMITAADTVFSVEQEDDVSTVKCLLNQS